MIRSLPGTTTRSRRPPSPFERDLRGERFLQLDARVRVGSLDPVQLVLEAALSTIPAPNAPFTVQLPGAARFIAGFARISKPARSSSVGRQDPVDERDERRSGRHRRLQLPQRRRADERELVELRVQPRRALLTISAFGWIFLRTASFISMSDWSSRSRAKSPRSSPGRTKSRIDRRSRTLRRPSRPS